MVLSSLLIAPFSFFCSDCDEVSINLLTVGKKIGGGRLTQLIMKFTRRQKDRLDLKWSLVAGKIDYQRSLIGIGKCGAGMSTGELYGDYLYGGAAH